MLMTLLYDPTTGKVLAYCQNQAQADSTEIQGTERINCEVPELSRNQYPFGYVNLESKEFYLKTI